ncbi:MAG: chemotaxis protein CheC [Limnochordia bacterium]|jgi:chemotaxis protein CheC|nr:chemotaxis protein CheC [Limnochordia bacterium]MDD2628644.1 chemotaxis protein CheC [Limnochordia bacterium]MDD4516939.1 chemotaxis protein CheC [Limnochordia bacterium]
MNQELIKDAVMDMLLELSNIGTGNAATSLSRMFGNEAVGIEVPTSLLCPISKFAELLPNPEEEIVGTLRMIEGDVGAIAFIQSLHDALVMAGRLLDKHLQGLDELSRSAIDETSNIMTASFVNALADISDMQLVPAVAGMAIGPSAAVLNSILVESGTVSDQVIVVESVFLLEQYRATGHIVFLPESTFLDILIDKFRLE